MSNLRGIAIALFILWMVGASSIVLADGQSAPQITDNSAKMPIKTSSSSAKAGIAPLETREISVKPPSAGSQGGLATSPSATAGSSSVISTPVRTTPLPTTGPTDAPENVDERDSANTYFEWGLAFARQNQYKPAMNEFEKALARDPQNLNTWYYLGVCAEALGYIEQAHNAYVYVLQVDPTFVPVTNVGGESILFPQIKANATALVPASDGSGGNQNDIVMSFFMGGVLIIFAIFGFSYIIRHHYPKQGTLLGSAKTPQRSPLSPEKINEMADTTMEYFEGDRKVIVELLTIASEIAAEGREGKHVGTAFIIGDTDKVLERSRPLILNPFEGHAEKSRHVLDRGTHESIKEVAQMDGAFIIRDDGVVVAAGRYISIDTSGVDVEKGLGTRHVSTGAITKATHAIGIVVSESGGAIRVFANGSVITSNVS
ncbi:MAG: diadenylate cyclase [Methanomicrobiales archaeon]|nr:diadenylate cyclase [Methanomicrobiales archaeon]